MGLRCWLLPVGEPRCDRALVEATVGDNIAARREEPSKLGCGCSCNCGCTKPLSSLLPSSDFGGVVRPYEIPLRGGDAGGAALSRSSPDDVEVVAARLTAM